MSESYSSELFVANKAVGGNGGVEFKLVGLPGAFVRKIRVYHDMMKWGSGRRGCLNGLELEFTDGKHASTGNTDSSQSFEECMIDVGKDEKVKSMSLWGMGSGKWDRTSEFWLETNKGTKLSVGSKDKKESEHKMDTGSGLLLGFQGRSGGGIDSLAPVFLKRVAKQFIDKVEYPDFKLSNTGFIQMQYLDRAIAVWNGVSGSCMVKNERSITTSNTWNTKTTIENSIGVTVTAKVPLLAEASVSDTLTWGKEKDFGQSESDTKTLACENEVTMEGPDDNFELEAIFYSGKQDVAYKGNYNVVTEDGQNFSFPTSGTLKQVMYSEVDIRVKRHAPDGEVKTKSIKRKDKEMRSLEDSEDGAANDEQRTLDYDTNGEEYDGEKPRDGEEGSVEEQVKEYTEEDGIAAEEDNAALFQEDETAAYNENGDTEPDYQANPEDEENKTNDYDQGADEEPAEPADEGSYYKQGNEERGTTGYEEDLEGESTEPNYEQGADNQYNEEAYSENREEEPSEQSEPNEQRFNNQYNEEAYNESVAEEPAEPAYGEVPEVQSSYRNEYSQSQSQNYENYEAQTDNAQNEYEASGERGSGGYPYHSYEFNARETGYEYFGVRSG